MKNVIKILIMSLLLIISISSLHAQVINIPKVFTIASGDSVIDSLDCRTYNMNGSFAYSLLPIRKAGTITAADSIHNYFREMVNVSSNVGGTMYRLVADLNNDSTVLYNRAVSLNSTLMPKQTLTSKVNSGGFYNIIKFMGDSGDTLYVVRNLEVSIDK